MGRSKIKIADATRLILLAMILFASTSCGGGRTDPAGVVKLQGAGASFPAPLYSKWFKAYSAAHANVQIDYQSTGSGSGVKSFVDRTVDFGASDAAMKPEDIARVEAGVQLLPMTAGSIVLTYNLAGINNLRLSRRAYTGIFLGEVTRWNDPVIADTNPGVQLPDATINVVVRADSSGTTYVFTKHLSAISEAFARRLGNSNRPNWPVGTRSKGNEGVAAAIIHTPGAIGYIEYGFAKLLNLSTCALENRSGNFIVPSTETGQAALSSVALPADLIVWQSDPEPPGAYPIVTYTWLLCYRQYSDKRKLEILKDLLIYCLSEGQIEAERLGYIPLPPKVLETVKDAVNRLTAAPNAT